MASTSGPGPGEGSAPGSPDPGPPAPLPLLADTGQEQRNRLRKALQSGFADASEFKVFVIDHGVGDGPCHENLPALSPVDDPVGEVDLRPEVVAVPEHGVAVVDADPRPRTVLEERDEADGPFGQRDRVRRDHHDFIADRLDDVRFRRKGRLDRLREPLNRGKSLCIAFFGRVAREAGQIDEAECDPDLVKFRATGELILHVADHVLFHEVAHGLGVKNLVKDPNKTVREALGPDYSAIEECKADVLGLYMVTSLQEAGVLKGKIEDFYITFVASVYRSVRFGASSAHGRANMITFNTLMNKGCLERTNKGLIVKVPEMKKAIRELAAELLHLQGDGDVDGVTKMLAERGGIDAALQSELDGIQKNKIPVDIVFEQGTGVLGLDRFNKK